MDKRLRERILVWLPVVLLPAANMILAVLTGADYDLSIAWLLGAMAEELFFRWFLLNHIFLRKLRPTFAILLVSMIFAAMHLFNLRAGQTLSAALMQVFAAFCFSIWAGAVMWKSTWLIPLLAHVLMNASAAAENLWVTAMVGMVVLADGIILMKGDNHMSPEESGEETGASS